MSGSDTEKGERLLDGAYALRSAQDNVEYYRDFAPIYDEQFVGGLGYAYPSALAKVYRSYRCGADVPVADIGCGTGLVAAALDLGLEQIDGVDISADMLAIAIEKSLYRSLYQVDLKATIAKLPCDYGAVVSAGTFTFGHLGPDTLPELLKIGRARALYCIGVNSNYFKQEGFLDVLNQLESSNKITQPVFTQQKIYAGKDTSHVGDMATVIVYRKR